MAVKLTDRWRGEDFRHDDRKPHTLYRLDKENGITVVIDTEKCPEWYDKAKKLVKACKHHSVEATMLHPQNEIQIKASEPVHELVSNIIQRNLFHDWYKVSGDEKLPSPRTLDW